MKKKLLLIGKHSFISSNINFFLKNKLNIKIITFEKFKKTSLKKIDKFNYVCNCSITKKYASERYEKKNDLDYYIAEKLKNLSVKFIFLSSRKIYSPKANLKEHDPLNPKENYSKNKLITEKKINRLLKNKVLILRISNLIGKPLKKSNRKVSMTFIDNFFKYSKENIILYENHFKDFLSVNQFTRIFYNILKNDLNGTFNVSLGKKVYVSEIIKRLNIKKSLKFKKIKIKKKDSFYLNNKKLNKILKLKLTKKELLNYCHKI